MLTLRSCPPAPDAERDYQKKTMHEKPQKKFSANIPMCRQLAATLPIF